MSNLTPEWLKTVLEVTGGFETEGNPWAGISNDFDNQGISCGILQWNIGQGSLQPLVKKCGLVAVKSHMPVYGDQLWDACNKSIPQGLQIVRAWQPNKHLRADVRNELVALFGSPEMVDQQMAAATEVGEAAMKLASRWATELRASDPMLREFCLFFDLLTQSGGMKNVWLDDVNNLIATKTPHKVVDFICTWMVNRPPTVVHRSDGKKNADLWNGHIPDSILELFVLTYLRCLKSLEKYQIVALNRRGTIATTRGWVNGSLQDLEQLRVG